ncbi:TetR/AcrR family transcriptional regulator [Nocardia nepalensis]|uniref:TetR/AcrR family transcriptional regulator n=1 Tax=Nocardia nepalensis TaxID=3375448 RepID=UPI003B685F12
MPAPTTRRQRQEQTRAKLLDAAARVFARRGYEGASVPEIAAEAGLSTGAIYSNFDGKVDLFHTLMAGEMRRQSERRVRRVTASPEDAVTAAGAQWADFVEDHRDSVLLLLEYCLSAARDNPSARLHAAEEFTRVRADLADLAPDAPPHLAAALQALAYGYGLQRLVDPDSTNKTSLVDAFTWLLNGASKTSDRPARGATGP